jgi:hypothetical protein
MPSVRSEVASPNEALQVVQERRRVVGAPGLLQRAHGIRSVRRVEAERVRQQRRVACARAACRSCRRARAPACGAAPSPRHRARARPAPSRAMRARTRRVRGAPRPPRAAPRSSGTRLSRAARRASSVASAAYSASTLCASALKRLSSENARSSPTRQSGVVYHQPRAHAVVAPRGLAPVAHDRPRCWCARNRVRRRDRRDLHRQHERDRLRDADGHAPPCASTQSTSSARARSTAAIRDLRPEPAAGRW